MNQYVEVFYIFTALEKVKTSNLNKLDIDKIKYQDISFHLSSKALAKIQVNSFKNRIFNSKRFFYFCIIKRKEQHFGVFKTIHIFNNIIKNVYVLVKY